MKFFIVSDIFLAILAIFGTFWQFLTINNVFVFQVSDILESDSGDYYCNANNPHGTAIEKNIKVIVNNPTSKG